MKLPVYIISRKSDPSQYLHDTSGQPISSPSKILMQAELDNQYSALTGRKTELSEDLEVRLIEEVEIS